MLVSDLRDELALHAHDPSYGEISQAQMLTFIASAARDARHAGGWLVRLEDDESLTAASTTYEYAVPTGFAYISHLEIEETINGTAVYVNELPRSHWDVTLNGGVPVFKFNTITQLTPGKRIKVHGQQRPTIYTVATQTIDAGMESFIRERALYFVFRYLGAGLSELARWRQQMAIQSWQTSEMFLRRHPQEFRMLPNAIEVPGRG